MKSRPRVLQGFSILPTVKKSWFSEAKNTNLNCNMRETRQKPTKIQMWPIWKKEFVVFLCSQGLYKVNAAKKWCCSRVGVYCWILVVYEGVTHLICFPEALQFQLEHQTCAKKPHGGSSVHRSPPTKKTRHQPTENWAFPDPGIRTNSSLKGWVVSNLGDWAAFWILSFFFSVKKSIGEGEIFFGQIYFRLGALGKGQIFWEKHLAKIRIQCQCYIYLLLAGWKIYHVWAIHRFLPLLDYQIKK